MPRTFQYSQWRRLALQGAMCVILFASVAAAAYITAKRRPAQVTLGEPTEHGRVVFALPKGWEVEERPGPPATVTAREKGRQPRSIGIMVFPPARRSSPEALLGTLLDVPGWEERVESLPMLGTEGAVVEVTAGI